MAVPIGSTPVLQGEESAKWLKICFGVLLKKYGMNLGHAKNVWIKSSKLR